METVINFTAKYIKILQGEYKGKRFKISNKYLYETPLDSILNGRILNEDAMLEALTDIQSSVDLENLVVVLDSNRVTYKVSVLPKCKPSEMLVMAKAELIDRNVFSDKYIYDYMFLPADNLLKNQRLVLCCSVDKEIVDGYYQLFSRASIKLKRMDVSLTSIFNLTAIFPDYSKETGIICVVDHHFVNMISFLRSGSIFTTRMRLQTEEISSDYYKEITDKIREYSLFKKEEEKREDTVNQVIYIFDTNEYEQKRYHIAFENGGFVSDFCIIGLSNAISGETMLPEGMDQYVYMLGNLI